MPRIMSSEKKEPIFRKRMVPGADLFVPVQVLSLIAEHADEGLESDKEVMGLLIGTFYRDDRGKYATVDRAVTSQLISDEFSVKFDESALEEMFQDLELADGESVVGWYHSHLDIGCFMSPTDVSTQDGIFGKDCGFAVVVDPVRKELKVFDGESKSANMVVQDND